MKGRWLWHGFQPKVKVMLTTVTSDLEPQAQVCYALKDANTDLTRSIAVKVMQWVSSRSWGHGPRTGMSE